MSAAATTGGAGKGQKRHQKYDHYYETNTNDNFAVMPLCPWPDPARGPMP